MKCCYLNKNIIAILLLSFSISSCKSLAQNKSSVVATNSSEKLICKGTSNKPLNIYEVSGIALQTHSSSIKLPKKYIVLYIHNDELQAYFKQLKYQPDGEITLPVNESTCITFSLENAKVMAGALAAKYPDIRAYKGVRIQDASQSIRLDYNGNTFNAKIDLGSDVFIISPWKEKNKTYYLLYNRQDSGYPKQPFE